MTSVKMQGLASTTCTYLRWPESLEVVEFSGSSLPPKPNLL